MSNASLYPGQTYISKSGYWFAEIISDLSSSNAHERKGQFRIWIHFVAPPFSPLRKTILPCETVEAGLTYIQDSDKYFASDYLGYKLEIFSYPFLSVDDGKYYFIYKGELSWLHSFRVGNFDEAVLEIKRIIEAR